MGNIFFERFAELCKGIGETPNSVAKTLGISSGSVTAWKNGTEPRNKTLSAIADHFGVSTDYLLGKETEKAPAGDGKRSVSDDELKFALWGDCQDVSDDDLADVLRYAAFVRERKKDQK